MRLTDVVVMGVANTFTTAVGAVEEGEEGGSRHDNRTLSLAPEVLL